ncbi:MAG: hypothetical protein SOW65_02535 [Candidatus Enterosoma sp.]|nr:hypothetical protein [bacterium]MDD7707075.1 hypothetical protein [bacterium]MDY3210704.1 hypothetical protein [Candidatus Enterosoma sp.]MDY3726264.1 hypothetical protein [Candidatus Enterosoma sp.]
MIPRDEKDNLTLVDVTDRIQNAMGIITLLKPVWQAMKNEAYEFS